MSRLAMKDFTFSDGTFIPQGTFVSAVAMPMHHDDEYYSDGEEFNPWRFSEMRDEDGEGLRHQMVSTGSDYIAFGHGKHAWYVFFYMSLKVSYVHAIQPQPWTILCC